MPNYLHRTTLQRLRSVASADLPEPEVNYILDPDYSNVLGEPVKYWIISGDTVSLVDQSTRDSINLVEDSNRKDGLADQVDTDDLLRAVAITNLELFNQERVARGASTITAPQYKNNVRGNL